MNYPAAGLLIGALLFLLTLEPAVAIAIALLGFLAHREITQLKDRVRALEGHVLVAGALEGAARPMPGPTHAPATTAAPAAAPTMRPAAAPPPEPPGLADRWRGASIGELEELVAGRLLAVVGGIALFLGGLFFLGLAFSRGWIGPELRVAIGLVAGVVLFALGGWLLRGPRQIVAHVLAAVGLGVFSVALFAATRLHGFFAPEFGVAAALVAAAAAAALAVRYDAQLIAVFGLLAVLGSPPLMGASASLVTMAFIGAALAGTTGIALFRTWRWLPTLAFVLTVPQLASYLFDDPPVGIALGAIGGFWLLQVIAAAGEELIERRNRLSATSATVMLATAAFTVSAGFVVLDGDLERWQGIYLLAVAVLHLALAAVYLVREGDRHPFGMLAAGTGIAAVTMAVPIQLGAEWVPLAWASEAVALAWIYVERRHWYSGLVAAVLGTLTAAHIVTVEYPIDAIRSPLDGALPFINASGLALGFVALAAGVAVLLLHARHERIAVAAVAAALVGIAIPHELSGTAEALGLTALGAGVVIVQRRVLDVPLWMPGMSGTAFVERALFGAAAVIAVPLAGAFFDALPVGEVLAGLSSSSIPTSGLDIWPFLDERSTVAVIVAGGALCVALVCDGRWLPAGILTAAAAIAWLLPVEVGGAIGVAGWAAMAAGLAVARQAIGSWLGIGARVLALAAALETIGVVAQPTRLWVHSVAPDHLAVLNGAVLATTAMAAMLAIRALARPVDAEARQAGFAAGAAAVYAASIALVDLFQAQVGGSIGVEELAKQAQVGLSVLWATIGSALTVGGLWRNRASLRLAGLGLLGVVTLKVFIVDLASLDIAYRVLSFVALGVLLLVAAYLYGRMQPRSGRTNRHTSEAAR
jgi:hypothetical protein